MGVRQIPPDRRKSNMPRMYPRHSPGRRLSRVLSAGSRQTASSAQLSRVHKNSMAISWAIEILDAPQWRDNGTRAELDKRRSKTTKTDERRRKTPDLARVEKNDRLGRMKSYVNAVDTLDRYRCKRLAVSRARSFEYRPRSLEAVTDEVQQRPPAFQLLLDVGKADRCNRLAVEFGGTNFASSCACASFFLASA